MFSDSIILVAGAGLSDRETILQALGDQGHVVASQTAEDALAHVTNSVALVICEASAGQLDGLDFLRRWKLRRPETPFLMLVDQREIASAVESMKHGAADCIVKPIDPDELRASVHQLMQARHVDSGANSDPTSTNGKRHKLAIDIPPDTSLEDLERAAVEQALVQYHGNRTHAARTLGISVRTLQRKLKAWGMPIVSFSNGSLSHSLNHSFMLAGPSEAPQSYSTHVH